jgi:hypothetical protein
MKTIELSAKTGAGMPAWIALLADRVRAKNTRSAAI